MDVNEIAARYASGLFPMDDPEADELPWWVADPRAIFELDDESLALVERRVRRSLRAASPSWQLVADTHFDRVITECGRPRDAEDGIWLTPRMHEMYTTLHAAGLAHTFELVGRPQGGRPIGSSLRELPEREDGPQGGRPIGSSLRELPEREDGPQGDGELLAGIVVVALGRAAMFESMCHFTPHAGNVLLVRALRALAEGGAEFCDIQMPTPHTERLGARLIPREEYEARLTAALEPSAGRARRRLPRAGGAR